MATVEQVAACPIREYVEGYDFRFDEGGGYTPSARERTMIDDAIHGYIALTTIPSTALLLARIEALEGALRSARGWVVTCSESSQARCDLKKLDATLSQGATDAESLTVSLGEG